MYAMIDSIIAKRRNGQVIQQDFLESLIIKHSKGTNTIHNEDNKLTDQQMKDNILTLLVAGHDTTTAALTWLIKFLGENPAVLKQLRVKRLFDLLLQFKFLVECFKSKTTLLLCRRNICKFKQIERMESILHGLKLIICLTPTK